MPTNERRAKTETEKQLELYIKCYELQQRKGIPGAQSFRKFLDAMIEAAEKARGNIGEYIPLSDVDFARYVKTCQTRYQRTRRKVNGAPADMFGGTSVSINAKTGEVTLTHDGSVAKPEDVSVAPELPELAGMPTIAGGKRKERVTITSVSDDDLAALEAQLANL